MLTSEQVREIFNRPTFDHATKYGNEHEPCIAITREEKDLIFETIQHLSQEVEQLKKQLKRQSDVIKNQSIQIDEYDRQLESAIVPKFKIGQEVWYNNFKDMPVKDIIEEVRQTLSGKLEYALSSYSGDSIWEDYIYATQAEAEQSLKGGE